MQAFLSDDSALNQWKRDKQKEVLHKCIIKAGFCPSHQLLGRLTIIKERAETILKEEFYLHYDSPSQKLLLRSLLRIASEVVSLTLERCGFNDIVFHLSVQEASSRAEVVVS